MTKANFFIIGMPRSGTSSLYIYLKQHPEVYLSIIKEPHYFGADLPYHDSYVKNKKLYNSLFANVKDEKIIGEGSVWYNESKLAAQEIKTYNSQVKIVILLRNPVDMILSLHSLYLRTGNEDVEDFNAAVQLQEQRKNKEAIPSNTYNLNGLFYKDIGLYYNKLKRYYNLFGKENIHVIIFDNFIHNPHNTYNLLLNFLCLNSYRPIFDLKEAKKIIRQKVLLQLKQSPSEIKSIFKRKRGYLHQKQKPYNISEKFKRKLLSFFKSDLLATSELINNDLMKWTKF